MNTLADIKSLTTTNPDLRELQNSKDTAKLSKQIETLFVTELMKRMFEQTSLGSDKVVNNFMPFITSEFAKAVVEGGGIGVGEFLTKIDQIKELTKPPSNTDVAKESTKATELANTKPVGSSELARDIGWQGRLSLPIKGRVSSSFGLRKDPFTGRLAEHRGIDIAVKENTEIKPAGEGRVVFSAEARGYGNTVIIDHGGGITTLYAHNAKNLVKVGDKVTKDTPIALAGATGRATGPHLHFEVRKDGIPVNPGEFLG